MQDASPAKTQSLHLRRWLVAFVVLGTALRLFRYGLDLPLWGDEGYLGVNILDRTFHGLLKPMEYIQVAPLGFLWAQRAMYQTFGMSEHVMRLIPTLSGIAALILFARWAPKILPPLPATLATAILAVSDLAIRHAVELKPYGIDLLMGIVLLYPAAQFLLDGKNRWLIVLIAVTPIALFMSLPSVLVAAGVAATLGLDLGRMTRRQRGLSIAFALVLCGGFAALVWGFIGTQFAGSGPSQQSCWVFPPGHPRQFMAWFLRVHTGKFFGYPLDCTNPGGAPSFALLVIGTIVLFRGGRRRLATLVISPFLMTFIAAVLRRYPYGDSPRVGQHLVGPICLLIGVGSAAIIERFAKSQRALRNTRLVIFPLLMVIGLIASAASALRPTSEVQRDLANRRFILDVLHRTPPNATIAVLDAPIDSAILSRWYLHEWPHRILWGVPISELPSLTGGPLVIVTTTLHPPGWSQAIIRKLGPPAEHQYQYFGEDEGACEIFVYPF